MLSRLVQSTSVRKALTGGPALRKARSAWRGLAAAAMPQEEHLEEGPSSKWPLLPDHEDDAVFPPPPPPPSEDQPTWTQMSWDATPLDVTRRIFCNRSLNMRSINAVGFDLDYTLAQYRPETFERLAHTETVKKLISSLGYPKVLSDWKFDWRYMTRGLIIDKRRGNVLKVDKHKYVKIAYHGFHQMRREDRLDTYNNAYMRFSFDEPDFAMIDTLFSLAEAHLFMQLVELHHSQPTLIPAGKDFFTMYRDVREAVDLCHRDGSIKQLVAADPGRYVHEDLRLLPLLRDLRAAGKKLFICTNSQWDYTHVLMNFLLAGQVGRERTDDWLRHFDVVFTGCGKPGFFHAPKPIYEVQTPTGLLANTDGGSPMTAIGEEQAPAAAEGGGGGPALEVAPGGRARVFQGGTYLDLHRMLRITSGAQVLYIGDHIYSDVLLSKKTLGWRTMLVVPELETEIRILRQNTSIAQELLELREQREILDDRIEHLEWDQSQAAAAAGRGAAPDSDWEAREKALEQLRAQQDEKKEAHKALLDRHHRQHHAVWGQLTKSGYANSQFAHQLERFACVYTSHVSNLTFYSPNKTHRAKYNIMSHECERGLLSPSSE